MEKLTNNNPDPHAQSLLHLYALKYLLAGDFQSGDPIDFLLKRVRAIHWDDPTFIAVSQEMRSGTPQPPPEQEALSPYAAACIHVLTERLAANNEAAAAMAPTVRQVVEQLRRADAALDFGSKMTSLYVRMRDRLEVLGADTEEYELPDFKI